MEEKSKNIIIGFYMICLIIVFGVSIAAVSDLKDDEKSHKTLEFYLIFLIILVIFFLTTSVDYFATKKLGSYVNAVKTLAFITFIVLTLLICFSSFDSDKFGSSKTETKVKAIAITIGIFGLLGMGFYVFMKYKKFGPETQFQEDNSGKIEDYKRLALDQVQERLAKASKATRNKDAESAYNVIISSIKNIKKTNDDKAKNKLLQYCSFLYSPLSYKLNNAASIYGPFNYTGAVAVIAGNNVSNEKANLQTLVNYVTTTNHTYGMIRPADTPGNNENVRSTNVNVASLVHVTDDQNWKDYSKSLSAELFGSASGGVKDALEKPQEILKFRTPFCRDLIAFYPVTTRDPVPLTNNQPLGCA